MMFAGRGGRRASWKTTRRAAGSCVWLQRPDPPGFLVSWRCSRVPPCTPEALELPGLLRGANGRRGLLYVPEGEPIPGGGPRGRFRKFGAPPAWEAPGRLGTAAAGGPWRVLGIPVTQGFPRYHGPAWLHGCAGRRAGANACGVHSFHPGCRPPYAPLALVAP